MRMNKGRLFRGIKALSMVLVLMALTFLQPLTANAIEPTPIPSGDIELNLIVAAIDPTLSSIDGRNYSNGQNTIKASQYLGFSLDKSVSMWIDNFEEISHNRVKINVVDTVIIDEFPKYISRNSLDNESFQKLFKKDDSGRGDWYSGITNPDYAQYDTCGELNYRYYIEQLDLVNRKNAGEFDMLFLIGIDPLSPYETCMVGKYPFWINGKELKRDCDNFVIITPTFSRQDGSIENIGHMAEFMLGYTYGQVGYARESIDGSDYSSLNDWQKYCLCEYMATPETEIYGYGMVHFSPNSESDYDWSNNKAVEYYKDFKNGEEVETFTSKVYMKDSFFNYKNDPCISHHRWWFYNMPFEDGRDEEGYLNNWWRYIFTADYVAKLSPAEDYPNREIHLKAGEEAELNFVVEYHSKKTYATNVLESEACVIIPDTDVFSYENGIICALKDGIEKVTVKIDGKSLDYTVVVEPEEVIEEAPVEDKLEETVVEVISPEVSETLTDVPSETLDEKKFDFKILIIAGAVIIVLGGVLVWMKKKSNH